MSGQASTSDEVKQGVAAVFDRVAPDYGCHIGYFEHFGQALVELAGVQPGVRVLDVAAGKGSSARPARDMGCEVVAVDLAPGMVAALQADGFDARLMDAEQLAFDDDSFDAVLCGFAIFFFPNAVDAARGFRRVVRSGGPVGCSMPLRAFPDFVYELRAEFEPRTNPRLPPPNLDFDGAAVLRAAGFEHVETHDLEAHFTLASGEELWQFMVSTGVRSLIERLSPEDGEELRRRMVERAGAGPLTITPKARFWVTSG